MEEGKRIDGPAAKKRSTHREGSSGTEPRLRPVVASTISGQVAQQLRELINSGEYKPGDRIPSERELSERLAVGRPAVREALRELKAQGLLLAGRGSQGTVVTVPAGARLAAPLTELVGSGAEHLLDLMELRSAVEIQSAGLAARRATLEDLRMLSGVLPKMGELGAPEGDVVFHRAIAEATHNALFRQMTRDLVDILHKHMPAILDVLYGESGGLAAVRRQHEAVVEAIRQGDEEGAREAMRHHLDYVTRGLSHLAGSNPLIRLVVLDLDGTLLAGPRYISERTKQVVTTVKETGVEVVLASARPPRSMRRYHLELGLTTPVIACNGALLWDMVAGIPLRRLPLEPELARELTATGRELGGIVNLDCDDDWFADSMTDVALENLERFGISPPREVGVIDAILESGRPIDKLFLDLRALELPSQVVARSAVSRSFSARARLSETVPGIMDVVSLEASKAVMARRLARSLNIPAEQVMAIGDHDNDVSLLRWAGIGVAMGNATADAKIAADAVTSSNLRDGVAEALERWVLEAAARDSVRTWL